MKKRILCIGVMVLLLIVLVLPMYSFQFSRGEIDIRISNKVDSDIIVWFSDNVTDKYTVSADTQMTIPYKIENVTSIALVIERSGSDAKKIMVEEYVEPLYRGYADVIIESNAENDIITFFVDSHISN